MKFLLFLVCTVLFLGILSAGCSTTVAPVPTPATTVPTPVPTVPVTVATTPPLTDPVLTGNWNFKGGMVAGGTMPAIPNVQITLKFNNDGTLTGFGGCNNYNAKLHPYRTNHGIRKNHHHRANCINKNVLRRYK